MKKISFYLPADSIFYSRNPAAVQNVFNSSLHETRLFAPFHRVIDICKSTEVGKRNKLIFPLYVLIDEIFEFCHLIFLLYDPDASGLFSAIISWGNNFVNTVTLIFWHKNPHMGFTRRWRKVSKTLFLFFCHMGILIRPGIRARYIQFSCFPSKSSKS